MPVTVLMGSSEVSAGIGGVVKVVRIPVGTPATAVATILMSFVIPAGVLNAASGNTFKIKAQGVFAATANAKLLTVELLAPAGAPGSGAVIFSVGPIVYNDATWNLDLLLVATSNTTQLIFMNFDVDVAGLSVAKVIDTGASFVDFTADVKLALVGQNDVAAAANDIQAQLLFIEYKGYPG